MKLLGGLILLIYFSAVQAWEFKDYREIVIVAASKEDPLYKKQLEHLTNNKAELEKRFVKVTSTFEAGHPFVIALFGRDGGMKLQRKIFVDVQEILDLIDSMPMGAEEKKNWKT